MLLERKNQTKEINPQKTESPVPFKLQPINYHGPTTCREISLCWTTRWSKKKGGLKKNESKVSDPFK